MVWIAWTIPGMAFQYQQAMNRLQIRGIWDPVEAIIRSSVTPTRTDAAFDWWLCITVLLATLVLIDVGVFYFFHRHDSRRIVARALSGAVTVLIAVPVWLMIMVVTFPMVEVWKAIS